MAIFEARGLSPMFSQPKPLKFKYSSQPVVTIGPRIVCKSELSYATFVCIRRCLRSFEDGAISSAKPNHIISDHVIPSKRGQKSLKREEHLPFEPHFRTNMKQGAAKSMPCRENCIWCWEWEAFACFEQPPRAGSQKGEATTLQKVFHTTLNTSLQC